MCDGGSRRSRYRPGHCKRGLVVGYFYSRAGAWLSLRPDIKRQPENGEERPERARSDRISSQWFPRLSVATARAQHQCT
jgi:hypothetical protein